MSADVFCLLYSLTNLVKQRFRPAKEIEPRTTNLIVTTIKNLLNKTNQRWFTRIIFLSNFWKINNYSITCCTLIYALFYWVNFHYSKTLFYSNIKRLVLSKFFKHWYCRWNHCLKLWFGSADDLSTETDLISKIMLLLFHFDYFITYRVTVTNLEIGRNNFIQY